MKYYIIAGEASGDLHASNLIAELKRKDPQAEIRAWGGDLMQAQGATIVKHYRDLAFMGFAEVVMNLKTILNNIKFCKADILEYKPDVIVLVDYPGFNLRIAEFAHAEKIKVAYYISPQVWAWKKSRVHKIRKVVDKMMVILPFEKDFYQQYDYAVEFVGHPLLDAIDQQKHFLGDHAGFRKKHQLDERPIIALLPGSRTQEIKTILPLMLSMVEQYPAHQFIVAGAPSQPITFYEEIIGKMPVRIIAGETYSLIAASTAALVTSGTATLETALLNTPEVVCYKGSLISYQIAKRIVDIKYISLVNLIMDKEVVKELIQSDLNTSELKKELDKILSGPHREEMLGNFAQLRLKLGGSGASKLAAEHVFSMVKP
jgi:lipid-A-disaccharide synthase